MHQWQQMKMTYTQCICVYCSQVFVSFPAILIPYSCHSMRSILKFFECFVWNIYFIKFNNSTRKLFFLLFFAMVASLLRYLLRRIDIFNLKEKRKRKLKKTRRISIGSKKKWKRRWSEDRMRTASINNRQCLYGNKLNE